MDDLISRQAAIDIVRNRVKKYTTPCVLAVTDIQQLPSVQPERKKGRWINANEGKWNTIVLFKCSVCGETDNRIYESDNFCPNCGADMRGKEDETD